ncbi:MULTISPECIES: hypothetical protein [unclassified Cyanobacterium]|uniref:hypothetical protein n=1 Tax=unclassified Cyanobacterium TaxID=2629879 RepID=UPI001F55B0BB|nr:hypothetical protein [Cyanobacterium sp. IPPAS B-1200]
MSVALWQYLNQPLFCRDVQQSVWKPSRFWYLYKIKFLEACLSKEFITQTRNPSGHDEFRAGN